MAVFEKRVQAAPPKEIAGASGNTGKLKPSAVLGMINADD
jgi:hypothetical protein